jgi:hypothetical protein
MNTRGAAAEFRDPRRLSLAVSLLLNLALK